MFLRLQLQHRDHHRVDFLVELCNAIAEIVEAVLKVVRCGGRDGLVVRLLHLHAYLVHLPSDPPEGANDGGAPKPFGNQSLHVNPRCKLDLYSATVGLSLPWPQQVGGM